MRCFTNSPHIKSFLSIVIALSALTTITVSCGVLMRPEYIHVNSYLKGYWGKWEPMIMDNINGEPNNFVIYSEYNHPSKYGTKVIVKGLNNNDVRSFKNREWHEYSGTIEFYSQKANAAEASRNLAEIGALGVGGLKYYHSRPAQIKIEKEPGIIVYNIYFDDVGIGLLIPR